MVESSASLEMLFDQDAAIEDLLNCASVCSEVSIGGRPQLNLCFADDLHLMVGSKSAAGPHQQTVGPHQQTVGQHKCIWGAREASVLIKIKSWFTLLALAI